MAQEPEQYGIVASTLPQGLNVGDKAPSVKLKSYKGESFSWNHALNQGPVVVMFYRGSWCPACSKQMNNLIDSLSYILEKGATVIAVSPERFDAENGKMGMNEGIIFLYDKDGKTMGDYDVDFLVTDGYQEKLKQSMNLDLAENNEQELATLPVPATFVVSQNGVITYRYFDINYKNRAPVSQIVEALK